MKKPIAFVAGFILCASVLAQSVDKPAGEKAPAPAVELLIDLADGSHVTGVPVEDHFKITTQLAEMQIEWARLLTVDFNGADHAAAVKVQNGDLLNGKFAAAEITVKTATGESRIPVAGIRKISVRSGSAGGDFVNSLGMEFVAVPGTKVRFAIWDTRVQDYRTYTEANSGVDGKWKSPGFKQGDDHPVVNVNWADATAFCAWLTQKERKEGKIAQDQEYRLPSNKEWSIAAGGGKFPWGDQWPPPEGAGNYSPGVFNPSLKAAKSGHTMPVGSFKANKFGLFDMGGNVWQWCGSWFLADDNDPAALGGLSWLNDDGGGKKYRVVRGASWSEGADPVYLMSAFRDRGNPGVRRNNYGFRCVLAPAPAAP